MKINLQQLQQLILEETINVLHLHEETSSALDYNISLLLKPVIDDFKTNIVAVIYTNYPTNTTVSVFLHKMRLGSPGRAGPPQLRRFSHVAMKAALLVLFQKRKKIELISQLNKGLNRLNWDTIITTVCTVDSGNEFEQSDTEDQEINKLVPPKSKPPSASDSIFENNDHTSCIQETIDILVSVFTKSLINEYKQLLSKIPSLVQTKIKHVIGQPGAFGWIAELENGHILKLFSGGTVSWVAGTGSEEVEWYKNLQRRAFDSSDDHLRSDLMIYDIGIIENGTGSGKPLNYVEMNKVLPWSDYTRYLDSVALKLRNTRDPAARKILDFINALDDIEYELTQVNTEVLYLLDWFSNTGIELTQREFKQIAIGLTHKKLIAARDLVTFNIMIELPFMSDHIYDAFANYVVSSYDGSSVAHRLKNFKNFRTLREKFGVFHDKLYIRYMMGLYGLHASGAEGRDLHAGNFGVTFENPMDPHFVFFDP